ncbi:MAG: deoxyhypusine synthase family protein [Alphaproteobacteria bacterium]|nr:deoxyhypusine synthase family protein [Alphaproteobacteria bacterium]
MMRHFIDTHFHHFNAAALKEAARAYQKHIEDGGLMFMTLAGAMSTAELGISLAEMIRKGKVSAICCTGANLEEDLFNAVAHDQYRRIANYRDLSPADEEDLYEKEFNRVTDTCIPETTAMRRVESFVVKHWQEAHKSGQSFFPHEFLYKVVLDPEFQKQFEIPKENSWVLAAAQANLPLYVPGWEDSTLGNFFVAAHIQGKLKLEAMKGGLHYMKHLVDWYRTNAAKKKIGFFQIGGGIAGDFPICVRPLINQDLKEDISVWSYFCQITDAQESYGGYSGALPNEKITWGKLDTGTPKFVIHSDATIVAPLIFAYVLGA